MKKFFTALGKAAFYFAIYFLMQVIFSIGAVIGLTVLAIVKNGTAEMDPAVLTQQVTAQLVEYTTLISVLSGIVSLLALVLLFLIRKKKPAEELSLRRVAPIRALAAVGGGLSCSLILSFLVGLIPFSESLVDRFETMYGTLYRGHPLLNLLAAVIVAPVVEEVFFRGLIYTRLKKGMPMAVAAAASALIFGLMHGALLWMLPAFLMGLVLVWAFEKTGSLWTCIAIHFLNNTLAFLDTSNMPWLDLVILGAAAVVCATCLVYFILEKKRSSLPPSGDAEGASR